MPGNQSFALKLFFNPNEFNLAPQTDGAADPESCVEIFLARQQIDLSLCSLQNTRTPWELRIFCDSRKACESLSRKLQRAGWANFEARIETFDQQQWQEAWKKALPPFNLTQDLRIVYPSQAKERPHAGTLFLQTGLAFGGGQHATTHIIAQWLAGYRGRYRRCLDIGCGTGILSLAAKFYGASEVVAIDSDPEAVRIARQNFSRNDAGSIALRQTSLEAFNSDVGFDWVCANLLSQILLENRNRIQNTVKPGGYLAISGIADEHAAAVEANYSGKAWRRITQCRRDGWAGFLFQHAPRGATEAL